MKTNSIYGLRDSVGGWHTDAREMGSIAVDYFTSLFSTSNPSTMEEVIAHVEQVVCPDMNAKLMAPYSAEEVKRALFQMSPSKSPGPDGMTALFFQKFWNIVGPNVTDAVLDFLNCGKMLSSINFTHIALVPKVKSHNCMPQFRPISLCNILYKIMSKVLVNRMKVIIPHVIYDSQSAFVPGRRGGLGSGLGKYFILPDRFGFEEMKSIDHPLCGRIG